MIETPLRTRIDISDGWEFVRGRIGRRWLRGRKSGGEVVDLPHCWNRTDTYQYGRRSYSGRGGYRKQIVVPEAPVDDGQWRLRSEGFYGFGDLWIDGRAFARIDGQYLGFEAPLPGSTTAATHLMTIRLDNFFRRRVLPGRSEPDFLLYGGLAGRVWLEWVPTLRIDRRSVEVVCSRGPDDAEILDEESSDPEIQLDLARAYISMGDKEAARVILEEVVANGTEDQQEEARKMLELLA